MNRWIEFPYAPENGGGIASEKPFDLYVLGGFWNPDKGCPDWGTSDPSRVRFIGDRAGDITVSYRGGKTLKIPLIFGFTLWYHCIWNERPAPFFDSCSTKRDGRLCDCLGKALFVKGAFEGETTGAIRIKLPAGTVESVSVVKDPEREGEPVFHGAYFLHDGEIPPHGILSGGTTSVIPGDAFFAGHCVDAEAPLSQEVAEALWSVKKVLYTFAEDMKDIPEYVPDGGSAGASFRFSGTPEANAATAIVDVNLGNLVARTDADGFIHTSYRNAPSWRYDGFGPYVAEANSYYDAFYSRDAARAIMTLSSYGKVREAEAGAGFGNRWMMYYPEQGLKICDTPVPGHFSVMPNKPLIYSTLLVPVAHWPTLYTEERFGPGYMNLGNQETDGHGLMMLANLRVWNDLGRPAQWVEDNWKYINEAASWIGWCFEHPDLSFAKDGLLYGETEAAMSDWTLYANLPCWLGLLGYAEMAEAAGRTEERDRWLGYARTIKEGIDSVLGGAERDGWDLEHKGFLHDPAPAMLSDYFGYDTENMPAEWIRRSRASYGEDISETKKFGFYAPGGLGYGHSMITQNALLLDMSSDYSELVNSLCRICYAPRLPEPYMVPEGISVDAKRGIFRRQGDLGNLVQQAEVLKCMLIVAGIAPASANTFTVMPRLPYGWSADVADFPVSGSKLSASLKTSCPSSGTQSVELFFRPRPDCGKEELASYARRGRVRVRFGPFSKGTERADVLLNGAEYGVVLQSSGDGMWGWVECALGDLIKE